MRDYFDETVRILNLIRDEHTRPTATDTEESTNSGTQLQVDELRDFVHVISSIEDTFLRLHKFANKYKKILESKRSSQAVLHNIKWSYIGKKRGI